MAGTREYEDLNKNLEIVERACSKSTRGYQDPEELYQALIARVRKYHPSADITMIEKAYQIGKEAHKNQFRKFRRTLYHPSTLGGNHTCRSRDGQRNDRGWNAS